MLKTEERGNKERKEVSSTRDDEAKNKIGGLRERPYIHCQKDADTIRRLQGEVDRLKGEIRQQRRRRMRGKRNLIIEVTNRGRKIKEIKDDLTAERWRTETTDEMCLRGEKQRERRNRRNQGRRSER